MPAKYIKSGDEVHPEALEQMKRGVQQYPGARYAAYQNHALDSRNAGHLQFLAVGPNNTYKTPPEKYPVDNEHGMGWRYLFVGFVDLESGEIKDE